MADCGMLRFCDFLYSKSKRYFQHLNAFISFYYFRIKFRTFSKKKIYPEPSAEEIPKSRNHKINNSNNCIFLQITRHVQQTRH
jgi:hypothetical protein